MRAPRAFRPTFETGAAARRSPGSFNGGAARPRRGARPSRARGPRGEFRRRVRARCLNVSIEPSHDQKTHPFRRPDSRGGCEHERMETSERAPGRERQLRFLCRSRAPRGKRRHRLRVHRGFGVRDAEVGAALPQSFRADLAAVRARGPHVEDRSRRHDVVVIQRAVQRRAAVRVARSDQRRARGLERRDFVDRGHRQELWPPASGSRAALRDRRRASRRGSGPVGQLGRRRARSRSRDRPVLRSGQAAPPRSSRPLLLRRGAAEHPPFAARAAGDLPGRLVGRRDRPRGPQRGRGVFERQHVRRGARVLSPGEGGGRRRGPQSRSREGVSGHRPDRRRDAARGGRQVSAGARPAVAARGARVSQSLLPAARLQRVSARRPVPRYRHARQRRLPVDHRQHQAARARTQADAARSRVRSVDAPLEHRHLGGVHRHAGGGRERDDPLGRRGRGGRLHARPAGDGLRARRFRRSRAAGAERARLLRPGAARRDAARSSRAALQGEPLRP
ncbi:hypothetical protein BURPS1710b_A1399 [Burkholderia pseudomallei 1710b]|uniref:Uncharacterized protein n=1 Tax=Burkholderia pseudomallei (strain 1710b) TaxID=320372 RepID=Q3JIP7_BURP1|nr:hypothetical protein BURPS1710b_A1399 [Burkholderia pseudomallei 1710b]